MTEIVMSQQIHGVKLVQPKAFIDERGEFREIFRKEWFPERKWDVMQMNRSDNKANVLRGLHYHFHQSDYWYALSGTLRVGLADLRRTSPTYGASEVLDIGDNNQIGVFIPPGVAHGFVTLSAATLVYVVDQYYNAADELGVLWKDPALKIAWQVRDPILSDRDQSNPLLADIPPDVMPL